MIPTTKGIMIAPPAIFQHQERPCIPYQRPSQLVDISYPRSHQQQKPHPRMSGYAPEQQQYILHHPDQCDPGMVPLLDHDR